MIYKTITLDGITYDLIPQKEKPQDPPKVARPRAEKGDEYFYRCSYGGVCKSAECGIKVDGYRHSIGNYFLTEEACEAANPTKYNQALTRVRDYIKINFEKFVPNLEDESQHGYCLWYNPALFPYLSCEEELKQVAADCKDDLDIIRTEGERLNNLNF